MKLFRIANKINKKYAAVIDDVPVYDDNEEDEPSVKVLDDVPIYDEPRVRYGPSDPTPGGLKGHYERGARPTDETEGAVYDLFLSQDEIDVIENALNWFQSTIRNYPYKAQKRIQQNVNDIKASLNTNFTSYSGDSSSEDVSNQKKMFSDDESRLLQAILRKGVEYGYIDDNLIEHAESVMDKIKTSIESYEPFEETQKVAKKYAQMLGSEPPSFLAPEEDDEDMDLSEFGGGYSEWGAEPPAFSPASEPKERDISWEDEPTIGESHVDLNTEELDLIKVLLNEEMNEDEAKGEDTEKLKELIEKINNMIKQ